MLNGHAASLRGRYFFAYHSIRTQQSVEGD